MKKGFTLIELLAVIVILGIIAVLVVPSVIGTINKSRNSLSKSQIETIEKAAEKWGIVNQDKMPYTGSTTVSIDTLADDGYLDGDDLKDPKTSKDICGYVKITYIEDNNQYDYEFTEEDCT